MLIFNKYGSFSSGEPTILFYLFKDQESFRDNLGFIYKGPGPSTQPKNHVVFNDCNHIVVVGTQSLEYDVDKTNKYHFDSGSGTRRLYALASTNTPENRSVFYSYAVSDLIYKKCVEGYLALHGHSLMWISKYDMHNILMKATGGDPDVEYNHQDKLLRPELS